METISGVVMWVIENGAQIVSGALMIVGGASLIAKLTPTKADDRIINKILGFLNGIALNPTKNKARR
ncbi:MAG TPA: hypothetical protein ENH30_01515 [Nitrospirae bacterium]|nr:hypothetical protein [Nitrospirota bacterium]